MSGRPSHSRTSSSGHRPNQPSALRQAHSAASAASSREDVSQPPYRDAAAAAAADQRPMTPTSPGPASRSAAGAGGFFASESSPLLPGSQRRSGSHPAHSGPCTHGTFSPRPSSPTGTGTYSIDDEAGGESSANGSETPGSGTTIPVLDSAISHIVGHDDWKRWLKRRIKTKKMGQSSELAERAGFRDTPLMYLSYYVPCLTWMQQYKASYIKGDLVAALTVASFYLPMALSLATNVAHVPAINGLYAFVFNPFVYALLGSCPQLIVGPEAAGSLLVGSVVKASVDSGKGAEENDLLHAQICGVVAGIAGAIVIVAGLARLGFLDSVLSRPFLRGFISAIGFVIAVDQLVPELGLVRQMDGSGVSHGSSVDKIRFMIDNISKVHRLTFAISAISFTIIMVCRTLKTRLQSRFPSVVFIPDRFLIVVISAILCWHFDWDDRGVEILGEVKAANGQLFQFRWPFQSSQFQQIRDSMSTSFLIALLGFFESSVAAKSLDGAGAIKGIQLSANRELIALGTANLVGASFMSLPAFGGYGRSKVNRMTGAKTPMSGIFLSIITTLSILFLLRYFYYLPKPVLSAMISAVAWSLIEEAPHDISFFLRVRGWKELGLMALIFVSTIFYSLTLGMALGVGVSLLLVIKHSTRPRIQILGRIPGTNRFENAESSGASLEFIEGCLIVKIPEPLTFANTGELKARLSRLERYGTSEAHPALPSLRSNESNRNIIFDIHGVTSMDGSATQVLEEIIRSYRNRGVRVFFSRGPSRRSNPVWRLMESSGIVDLCGGESHFVPDVEEALRWTEYEESVEMGSAG